jgi:hypothetical protein
MKAVVSPSEPHGPVRLIAGGGSARERRLLEAALEDGMPPGTQERIEQALSAWAASPSSGAGGLGGVARRLGRWGIIRGLGGLAVVGSLLAPGSQPVADAPSASVAWAPVTAAAVAPAPLPSASASAPVAVTLPAPPRRISGAAKHRAPPRTSRSVRRTAERDPTDGVSSHGNLLEEARRLEAVRSALGAGNGPAARRELMEYRARFVRGELRLEADVLEAELLLSAGELERARVLATALLARPDAGRYRQRLERLLRQAPPSERRASPEPASSAGSNRTSTNMDERR